MARTAFVTGGTGFLGRHIVEQLVGQGWSVVALHRPTSDVRALVAFGAGRVELAVGSITDPASLARSMPRGADAAFHVAGNTSLWSGGDAQQTLENVAGTRNVVQAALDAGVRAFVHTSSVAAWGDQHDVPFDETAPQRGAESFINYERTKLAGELEVLAGVAKGLRAVILNPGHIAGRYDTHSWARLIRMVAARKLPGVTASEGTWAHADKVAAAHLAAVDRGRSGERYLLGGAHASFVEVVRVLGRLTGQPVPTRPTPAWVMRALGRVSQWGSRVTGKAPTVTPEIAAASTRGPHLFKSDKAIAELGYDPSPLETMLSEAVEWLRAEGLLTAP